MRASFLTEELVREILENRDVSDRIRKQTYSQYAMPKYEEEIQKWFNDHRELALFLLAFQDSSNDHPTGYGGVYEIVRPAGTIEAYVDFPNFDARSTIQALDIISDLCLEHIWFSQLYSWVPVTNDLISYP